LVRFLFFPFFFFFPFILFCFQNSFHNFGINNPNLVKPIPRIFLKFK
jgi:hypothetical protein